jgi:hypothetical protein
MVGSHLTPGGLLRPNAEGGLLRVKEDGVTAEHDRHWGNAKCAKVFVRNNSDEKSP